MKKSLDFDLEVSLYQIATLALSSSSVVVRKYDTDKLTSKDTNQPMPSSSMEIQKNVEVQAIIKQTN